VTMVDDGRTRRSVLKDTLAAMLGVSVLGNAQAGHAEENRVGKEIQELRTRMVASELKQLPADFRSTSDIEYPAWLEGTWQVTARFDNFSTPLGVKFLGGSSPEINQKSSEEARSKIGSTVDYQLRFEKLGSGKVREDRLFNTEQRLNAYAKRTVVRSVEYVAIDRGQATKELNTLTYYKGGLVGKSFSTRRRWSDIDSKVFFCDECSRQLFAIKCNQAVQSKTCPPPIVTDQESITEFEDLGGGLVRAHFRLLGFLNPNSALFFDARQEAVTISDYTLEMKRLEV